MEAESRIAVVVIDDHEVVRRGVRHLLAGDGVATVVGEAGSLREARAVIASTEPDVAIIDVVLPDGDGVQLCRELLSRRRVKGCLLLTSFPDDRALLSAVLAGAAGYFPKGTAGTELRAAIRAAARGGTVFDRDTATVVLERLRVGSTEHPTIERLSPQERRVFELIGQGMSNREIARLLSITEKTVKNYVSRVYAKLDLQRRTEAAALSARLSERRAQAEARSSGSGTGASAPGSR